MQAKLVALIVAASLTTGWLLASIVSPPVALLQSLPTRENRSTAIQTSESDVSYTEQLHLKLQAAPTPPVPRRNPFVFGTRERVVTRTAPVAKPEMLSAEPSAMPVATGPSLRLVGIGSTGDTRTAVISDGADIYLVKIGETVGGYAVVAIAETTITIADAAGAEWLLRMH